MPISNAKANTLPTKSVDVGLSDSCDVRSSASSRAAAASALGLADAVGLAEGADGDFSAFEVALAPGVADGDVPAPDEAVVFGLLLGFGLGFGAGGGV